MAGGRPQPGNRPNRPARPGPPANRPKAVPAPTAVREPPARASDSGPASTALDWIGLVLIVGIAVLCALLEVLLIPTYIGSVILPISAVAALAGNIVLPWWGFRTVGRGWGAVLPVLAWLVVVLGLTVVTRPEGDVIVSGAHQQSWVYYAVVLLGAVAGFTTVLRVTSPR